jgi:hypothetical protein
MFGLMRLNLNSKKKISTFGGSLISTNIHLRKEGPYDYALREGENGRHKIPHIPL